MPYIMGPSPHPPKENAGKGLWLDNALVKHGLGHLHETGDVCSLDIVYIAVRLCAILGALLVDRAHDVVELLVHLLLAPVQADRVLCHLQT